MQTESERERERERERESDWLALMNNLFDQGVRAPLDIQSDN